jgi:hypothetical protein
MFSKDILILIVLVSQGGGLDSILQPVCETVSINNNKHAYATVN